MNRRGMGMWRLSMLALGGMAAAAPVYLSYRRDLEEARRRVAAGSRVIETGCGRIEYATRGEGPAVLVIHGAGGGYDQAELLAEPFGEGYRYIIPSRFGYLRTQLPNDGSPAAQAAAYACLLDALNVERAAVLCSSAGGLSAVEFAARYPERTAALVMLAPDAWVPEQATDESKPGAARAAVEKVMLNVVLKSDLALWLVTNVAGSAMDYFVGVPQELGAELIPEERREVRRLIENVFPVSMRQRGLINDAENARHAPRAALESVAAPTLIVSAADDPFGTLPGARYTAEHIPGARLIELERGGHTLMGPGRSAVGEAVGFLREKWPV